MSWNNLHEESKDVVAPGLPLGEESWRPDQEPSKKDATEVIEKGLGNYAVGEFPYFGGRTNHVVYSETMDVEPGDAGWAD